MRDIEKLKSLDQKELMIFNAEVDRRRKHVVLAYLFLFLLGYIGGHQFYLGRWLRGLTYIVLLVVGWTLGFAGLAAAIVSETVAAAGIALIVEWGASGILVLLLLWDLITMPRQARIQEERVRREILARLRAAKLDKPN